MNAKEFETIVKDYTLASKYLRPELRNKSRLIENIYPDADTTTPHVPVAGGIVLCMHLHIGESFEPLDSQVPDEDGVFTALVTQSMLDEWGFGEDDTDELLATAFANITPIIDHTFPGMIGVTVAGNTKGAAAILCDNTMKVIADSFHEDYYVFPSSIHEMVCVPCSALPSDREAINMQQTIQMSGGEFDPREWLSNKVFRVSYADPTQLVEVRA